MKEIGNIPSNLTTPASWSTADNKAKKPILIRCRNGNAIDQP